MSCMLGSFFYYLDDTSVLELEVDTKLTMKGTGDPEECEEILSLVLKPDTGYNCQPKPCAIGEGMFWLEAT